MKIYGSSNILNTLYKTRNEMEMLETRLSTGKMINTAADNPMGVAISSRLQAQINQNKITNDNLSNARFIFESMDLGFESGIEIFTRIKEIALEVKEGNLTNEEEQALEYEAVDLRDAYNNIVNNHDYEGVNYLADGMATVSINTGTGYTTFYKAGIEIWGLEGVDAWGNDYNPFADVDQVISNMEHNLDVLTSLRGYYGNLSNTFSIIEDHQLKNQALLEKRYASIMDVDTAKTTSDLAKLQLAEETNIMLLQMQNERNSSFLELLSF
jgi:flagellin